MKVNDMNGIIEEMLSQHNHKTLADKKNSIKEIVQEIILCGLSRSGFFKEAAFYGGTALRIFYGLDRFSEDLDFSLISPDPNYSLEKYLPFLERELGSYGFKFEIEMKHKNLDSGVQSAFVKGNTREHILICYSDRNLAKTVIGNEMIKIKFEIDTLPPPYAGYDIKYLFHMKSDYMTCRLFSQENYMLSFVGHGKTESKEETSMIISSIWQEEQQ